MYILVWWFRLDFWTCWICGTRFEFSPFISSFISNTNYMETCFRSPLLVIVSASPVLQEHTQKQNFWMFITATVLWTKQCLLYPAITEMLAHSPLINSSIQCRGVQSRTVLAVSVWSKQDPSGKRVLSWLAGWPILINRCANHRTCTECPGRASSPSSFEVNLIRSQCWKAPDMHTEVQGVIDFFFSLPDILCF